MKIEHLQYFIVLANSSSISKAAEKLFISQQQLNRIITSLEEEVDAKLLSRTTNGITMTEDGQDFLTYAQNIVNEYSALKSHFYLRKNPITINPQTPPAECRAFLTPCLSIYANELLLMLQKAAPNIQITFYDKTTRLCEGYYDHEALCFWASYITPDDLTLPDGQTLKTLVIGESQAYFAYNKALRQYEHAPHSSNDLMTSTFSHVFSDQLHSEKYNIVSSNVHQLLESVLQNNNVCTLPDFVLPKMRHLYPDIAYLPIDKAITPIYVAYPSQHELTKADEVVIDFVRSYIRNLQDLLKKGLKGTL